MTATSESLLQQYEAAMLAYLDEAAEFSLKRAYELGRKALNDGLGVVDMAALYHQALRTCLSSAAPKVDRIQMVKCLGDFFVESLAPFEMTHRGYRDAHAALHRLNEMMEDQAKRIAHALHDEAGQLLAAVYIGLEDIALDLPPALRERLANIKAVLDEVEEQLRRLSHELRPTILDDLGLVPALQFLAERVSKRTGLDVRVQGATENRLPPTAEIAIYRIVQECLNNVTRHANAQHVTINVEGGTTKVLCAVRDDGIGFDVSEVSAAGIKHGLGLLGIRERLKALGGSLEIASSPNRGTDVLAQIPLGH